MQWNYCLDVQRLQWCLNQVLLHKIRVSSSKPRQMWSDVKQQPNETSVTNTEHLPMAFHRPPTKLRGGNVMFSLVSVCSQGTWGVSMWPFLMMHWISLYRALTRAPVPVTPGDHHWRPVQTCSLQDLPPVLTSGGQSTYGWQMVV